MEWQSWANVELRERHKLPIEPGIYVVVDSENTVWHVGKSINLNARWNGKSHHRYKQLSRSNNKRLYKIYWQVFPGSKLDERERLYISLFKPHLNYRRVIKYVKAPSKPKQELQRILKVINKNTQLFPIVRSVVLGYYKELDIDENCQDSITEYTCIIVALTINDHDRIVVKSCDKSTKKKGLYLRDSWKVYEATFGEEDNNNPLPIACFIDDNNIVYEFVALPHFIQKLINNLSWLEKVELDGQSVLSLKDMNALSLLDEIPQMYLSRDIEYIRYRTPELRCISSLLSDHLTDQKSENDSSL